MANSVSARFATPLVGATATLGIALLGLFPGSIAGSLVLLAAAASLPVVGVRTAVWVLLGGYAIHPLLTRLAVVDLGIGATVLSLASAWKEVALASMMAIAFAQWRQAGTPLRLVVPDAWAAVLVVLATAAIAIAQDTLLALGAWRLMLFPIGLYVVLRLHPIGFRPMLVGISAIGAVLAVAGIVQSTLLGWPFILRYYANPDGSIPPTYDAQFVEPPRAIGTLFSPNELGLFLAFAGVCAAAAVLGRGRISSTRLLAAALALIVIGLGLSISRSAIFGGILGLLTVGAWFALSYGSSPSSRARWLVGSVGLAVVVVTIAYASNGTLLLLENTVRTIAGGPTAPASTDTPRASSAPGRTTDPAVPPPDPSTEGHIVSLRESVALLADHPLGVGLGNVGTRTVPGARAAPEYLAESWYLTLGLSLGWLGFLWAVSFFPMFVVWTVRSIRSPLVRATLAGLMVTAGTVGVVLPTLTEPVAGNVLWSVLAAVVASAQRSPVEDDGAPTPAAQRT